MASDHERIADLVWANRIRRDVLILCARDLGRIRERERRLAGRTSDAVAEVKEEQSARDGEREFWCLATEAEAHYGLGDVDSYELAHGKARRLMDARFPGAQWMMDSFDSQISRLRDLLDRRASLLLES